MSEAASSAGVYRVVALAAAMITVGGLSSCDDQEEKPYEWPDRAPPQPFYRWDPAVLRPKRELRHDEVFRNRPSGPGVCALATTPSRHLFVARCVDGVVAELDAIGDLVRTVRLPEGAALWTHGLTVDALGRLFIARDGGVLRCDFGSEEARVILGESAQAIAADGDGRLFIASGAALLVADADGAVGARHSDFLLGAGTSKGTSTTRLAFDRERHRLIAGRYEGGTVDVFDAELRAIAHVLVRPIVELTVDPYGRILSADRHGITLVDASYRETRWVHPGPEPWRGFVTLQSVTTDSEGDVDVVDDGVGLELAPPMP